jgi:hypothetical protein
VGAQLDPQAPVVALLEAQFAAELVAARAAPRTSALTSGGGEGIAEALARSRAKSAPFRPCGPWPLPLRGGSVTGRTGPGPSSLEKLTLIHSG